MVWAFAEFKVLIYDVSSEIRQLEHVFDQAPAKALAKITHLITLDFGVYNINRCRKLMFFMLSGNW